MSSAQLDEFLTPQAVHDFQLTLESGKQFNAFRVGHNNQFGPYKGGIRYHPSVCLEEVQALATLMSLKIACVGLPFGGGKGGVQLDPAQLSSAELKEVSQLYVHHLKNHLGSTTDIPAPDVNTSPQIMDWMADEYSLLTEDVSGTVFSGKSLAMGGSLGRLEATGRGGVIVLDQFLKLHQFAHKPLKIALQGCGNVGGHFARIVKDEYPNWQIVAVADESAALYQADGLPWAEILTFVQQGKRLVDFSKDGVSSIEQAELLALDVDVLVLAALGDVIDEHNEATVKARYILELANAPLTKEALVAVSARQIRVIPSLLASSGGVIVSYLEYCQNILGACWSLGQVNQRLASIISTAGLRIHNFAQQHQIDLYLAAFCYGLAQFFVDTQAFKLPLQGKTRLTRDYGWCFDDRNGVKTKQNGVYLAASAGDQVSAVGYGIVIGIDRFLTGGSLVTIEHRLGLRSCYGSVDKLQVKEGDLVATGQVIGSIIEQGSDGLYFALLKDYHYTDPKPYLADWGLNLQIAQATN